MTGFDYYLFFGFWVCVFVFVIVIVMVINVKFRNPLVAHSLAVRSAVHSGNYHRFFKLYQEAPNLAKYLMDLIKNRLRLIALQKICKAYRPSVSVDFVLKELRLEPSAGNGSDVNGGGYLEMEDDDDDDDEEEEEDEDSSVNKVVEGLAFLLKAGCQLLPQAKVQDPLLINTKDSTVNGEAILTKQLR